MNLHLTKEGKPRQRVGPGAPPADRILLHTDRSGEHWIWTGAIDKTSGYGRLTIGGKVGYSHRVSYEAFVGPIPDDREVDHLCRVRACCNPEHLEAVPPSINVLRGMSVGAQARRRTVCFQGVHEYAEHGREYEGRRSCRECNRDYCRLYNGLTRDQREERKSAGLPVVDLAAHYRRTEQVAA